MQFADLHDTPGRMEARGAIRKAVPWSESRSFFYWRLRRRLAEFDLRKQVLRGRQQPRVEDIPFLTCLCQGVILVFLAFSILIIV